MIRQHSNSLLLRLIRKNLLSLLINVILYTNIKHDEINYRVVGLNINNL